jgi:predicted TIM-barrel fold metal-dependent hydrolase
MARFTRRHLLTLISGAALFSGARYGHRRLARAAPPDAPLSDKAKALISRAWQGLDPKKVVDVHVHVAGVGYNNSGCYVGERMRSKINPLEFLKYSIYQEASGVEDDSKCEVQWIDRLAGLLRTQAPHGRVFILGFDEFHTDDGKADKARSEFYTPNSYVTSLAKSYPDLFVPVASVHPYRADAVDELEKAVANGAVAVKWLPNAQNINPSLPRCDAFYDAMARLKIPLITHSGEEKAVHAEELQRLGNPLLLRRALDRGVTVVVAHCASLGQNPDLDAPGEPMVDNFDLFMRLMKDPQWVGKLWGEVSAMTIVNRVGRPLAEVLKDDAVLARLVNGSDYPLPAINVLMQTGAVHDKGFITAEERETLNEIDRTDPLLMDFVMKRCLRLHVDGKEKALPDATFMVRPEVFPALV